MPIKKSLVKNKTKRWLMNICGIIAMLLGAIGLVLPLLPTTPFWLLGTYLLMSSNPQLNDWIMQIKIVNRVITNYRVYKAISLSTKIISISLLWITLCISALFINHTIASFILLIIGIGVTWHIASYKTLKK